MQTDVHKPARLLTVNEVAQRLRVSRATVYRMIRTGKVPALQLGTMGASLRVDEAELEQWLNGPGEAA